MTKSTRNEPSQEPEIIVWFGPWEREVIPEEWPERSVIISPSLLYIRITPSYPPETKPPSNHIVSSYIPPFNAKRHVIQQLWCIVFASNPSAARFQSIIELSYPLQQSIEMQYYLKTRNISPSTKWFHFHFTASRWPINCPHKPKRFIFFLQTVNIACILRSKISRVFVTIAFSIHTKESWLNRSRRKKK